VTGAAPERLLAPGLGILAAAAALGLAVNALRSRDRIELGRAYFGAGAPPAPIAEEPGPRLPRLAPRPAADSPLARRARAEFRVLDLGEAAALADRADRAPDEVLPIDARDAAHFRAGHLPGALPLDPYNLASDLPPVLPLLRQTAWLLVYCESVECEDGLMLCRALRDQGGIEPGRILLFVGGMREWREAGLPERSGRAW
jgi:rhodanese-related sulfurtransferase